jgi:MFS family permease
MHSRAVAPPLRPDRRAMADKEGDWPAPAVAWGSVAALLLAYMVSFADRQILSLLVGPIKADLALSDTQFSLLAGLAFAMFYTLMGLPFGRLADRARAPYCAAVQASQR